MLRLDVDGSALSAVNLALAVKLSLLCAVSVLSQEFGKNA